MHPLSRQGRLAGLLGRISASHASDSCGCSLPYACRPSPGKVYARGSGKVRDELTKQYGCPYSFESALITLQDCDLTTKMERFLYGVARSYSECFRVSGEQKSFEWQQLADKAPVIYTRTGDLEKVDIITDQNTQSIVLLCFMARILYALSGIAEKLIKRRF